MKAIDIEVRRMLLLVLALLLITGIPSAYAAEKLGCDSTCFIPFSMDVPKVAIHQTSQNAGGFTPNAKCGASAGSILPSAPNSFLCSAGNSGPVTTISVDGEISYSWTCTSANGSSTICAANQRELGQCGTSNGVNLSSMPTTPCAGGEATGFAIVGNTYKWMCVGNYGPTATCQAQYTPPAWETWIGKTICTMYFGITCGRGSVTITSNGRAIGNGNDIDIRSILTFPAPTDNNINCGTEYTEMMNEIFFNTKSSACFGGNLGYYISYRQQ